MNKHANNSYWCKDTKNKKKKTKKQHDSIRYQTPSNRPNYMISLSCDGFLTILFLSCSVVQVVYVIEIQIIFAIGIEMPGHP